MEQKKKNLLVNIGSCIAALIVLAISYSGGFHNKGKHDPICLVLMLVIGSFLVFMLQRLINWDQK